jgi:ribosomal protein S18 acetylase RimI-like enzyme
MTIHPLDQPVWASLNGDHTAFALRRGQAVRYPREVAPFVATDDAVAGLDLDALVEAGEQVCFVGTAPTLSGTWRIDHSVSISQLTCATHLDVAGGPAVTELTDDRHEDMAALAALVYPHYFRAHTHRMGRYIGIYDGHRLAAMAGERMRFPGHQEISAVCTHPDYIGRGYAQRLVAMLTNDILAGGRLAFLHVSHDNVRARRLYERLGYVLRADIPLLVATRRPDGVGMAR